MHDIFVEDFESELFTEAFKKYFYEISTSERNWEMMFRQMNSEKDTTKAIMRLDGNTVVAFIMFCEIELKCAFFSENLDSFENYGLTNLIAIVDMEDF